MERIQVLIISGLVTAEHNYHKMNEYLREMLMSTGVFAVKVTEEFNGCTQKTLEPYDLIVLNYDGKENPASDDYQRWDAVAEEAFFEFVRSGKGLVIHHSSVWLNANLPDRYKELWGIYMESPQSRRNPNPDVIVQPAATVHPIMKGLEEFMVVGDDFFAGAYYHQNNNAEVLAVVYDDVSTYKKAKFPPPHHPVLIPNNRLEEMRGVNTKQPVAWVNRYGAGRVFACSLGHDIDTYRRENYLTMLVRGAQWAASGQVTLDKPDRSGENRFRPWPYY